MIQTFQQILPQALKVKTKEEIFCLEAVSSSDEGKNIFFHLQLDKSLKAC